ncbi:MAG: cupin domain-containing protein [Planctomycetes bacterium]|nr:cupin domain-containing protein [Planctomycetota bacterium]
MIIIDINKVKGMWTKGINKKFLTSMLSPGLQDVKGLSIGMVIVPPKTEGGLHSHEEAQEFWYIIDGKGRIQIGEEECNIRAGQLIYGPPNVKHQIINDSNDRYLRALLILCPPGDESPILEELKRTGGVRFEEDNIK